MPRVETWGFESARTDGTGVFVRLTLFPDEPVAWYWAYVFLPDSGLTVVRDHEVPLPRRGLPDLEVRADSLWAELVCETPHEHWGIGLEAFGVVLDDPWDARRGELGIRVPVGLDLEWEFVTPPWHDGAGHEYQTGRVHGEIIVGTEHVEFDGFGTHDEGRGLPADGGRHRAAFAVADAVAAQVIVEADGNASGYTWRPGSALDPLTAARVEAHPAAPAVPTALRYVLEGSLGGPLEVEAEVAAVAVVPLDSNTYLLEALARGTVVDLEGDERAGAGFAEWIRTTPPLG